MSQLMEAGVLRGCFHAGSSDEGMLPNRRELVKVSSKSEKHSWSCLLASFYG